MSFEETPQLSAAQIIEIKRRLSKPSVFATDEQVENFFQEIGIYDEK
jgi:hypothetical protein